jgi:hypothetical protein
MEMSGRPQTLPCRRSGRLKSSRCSEMKRLALVLALALATTLMIGGAAEVQSLECSGYKATYYGSQDLSGQPVLERCKSAPLQHNWGEQSPAGVPNENWSASYVGEFNFEGGTYQFDVASDDGIRIYIDGSMVYDRWMDQGAALRTFEKNVATGTHTVRVEYYDNLYNASVKVSWHLLSSDETAGVSRRLGAVIDGYHGDGTVIDNFNKMTGHNHSVIHTFDRFGEYSVSKAKLKTIISRGAVPISTLEPYNASLSSIAHGDYDAWIDEYANMIASLDSTVYVRFAHEMNGDWFPWGQKPYNYRAAFQRVAQRVHTRAPNARMVFSPNVDHGVFADYYPGDVAVDYMALDGYNDNGNSTPRQVFAASYDELAALDPDDPIMIAETGSIEYSGKANWIRNLYMGAVPNRMPRIDLVVWFHVNMEGIIPTYRLDTSQAALDAYRAVADSPEWE